ncbi:serine/threonine-protein kinase [Glaciecola petra]|uniref:Serine/threonine-protein kinase n=1 Tax=Glaciecola petra TaxID=3075602 RepID=A0ABU2ZRJ6_9ALTE|nr:serine/threonine-protein kinase [Aestuariibacter sp. P117]MDT0594939.1 serine/threonine-protein kinase [Aestuariibacter sp. P117]
MLDWAKISNDVEHALTLDDSALKTYLKTIEGTQEAAHIKRLLQQSNNRMDFLATSISNEGKDKLNPENDNVLEAGSFVGPWQIEHAIGQGGMGDVYQAKRADGLYEQTVAIKVMQGLSPSRAALFEVERQRLALMNHPGIARIIDGGTSADGRLFMAMEFIDGQAITEYIANNNLSLKSQLVMFLHLCNAVEHAHSQLVLHRDIKAQNVLVNQQGKPCLIDFGIASDLEDETGHVAAFSLATAAPEQLKGETVSVQTDVFALGLLLHEIVSGKAAIRQDDGGMQVSNDAIADRDILAIIEKSLALQVENRYSSISSLTDDISDYLDCKPVSARIDTWRYRASKFIQRYPFANLFGLLAVISLTVGLVASLNFAKQADTEAQRAKLALTESEQSLAQANFYLDRADLFHATQSAYADTLQSMFGAEADVDKQTSILKGRWQQAYELRESDPNNAAFLSYAIGRHFLFRNDYLTAIDVFQPWVDEEYGPPALLGFGRQMLAIAYFSVGREQDALPLLRKTEAWMAASFDANTPDHIAAATQIAILTEEPDDITKAEGLLLKGLSVEIVDPLAMYFWNQTSKLRQLRGDFPAAYEAIKEVANIIDAKPLIEISGTDTGLLNLAEFELWHTQDLDRAETIARRVIDTVVAKKGESRELGIAYSVLANRAMLQNDVDAALSYIDQAIPIIEKYSGASSNSSIYVVLDKAEYLALNNDASAKLILRQVADRLSEKKPSSHLDTRLGLAELFVSFQLEGLDAANKLAQEKLLDTEVIQKNIELSFMRERLVSLGVSSLVADSLEKAQ